MQDISGEHGVYVALAHLVGFEGGKAFVGGSLIAGPRGNLIVEGPVFEEALITASLDLSDIARVRAEMPLLADLEARLPSLAPNCSRRAAGLMPPHGGPRISAARPDVEFRYAAARPPFGGLSAPSAPASEFAGRAADLRTTCWRSTRRLRGAGWWSSCATS